MPVRKKIFLQQNTIKKEIIDLICNFAIAHYNIEWRLFFDEKEILNLKQKENLSQRIIDLYGLEFFQSLKPVYFIDKENKVSIEGYISSFHFYKSNSSYIKTYVNKRIIYYKKILGMLKKIYGELMPAGRFPISFLFITTPYNIVDVNIHPQKKEIRFQIENKVNRAIYSAVREVIENNKPYEMRDFISPNKKEMSFFTKDSYEKSSPFDMSIPIPFKKSFFDTQEMPESISQELENLQQSNKKENSFMPEIFHCELFDTFILASSQYGMYLIDKHTAHERINYEKFLSKLQLQETLQQHLVIPVSVQVSKAESYTLQKSCKSLENIGFSLENLGPAGWQITSVPFYVPTNNEEDALHFALKILDNQSDLQAEKLFSQMAKDLSCRHSIKKGNSEPMGNIQGIVSDLSRCKVPGRCPHGRPTMIFLGKYDIFHLFKRFP